MKTLEFVLKYLVLILLVGGAWFMINSAMHSHPNKVEMGGKEFKVSVARTTAEKDQGLSGIYNIPPDQGMLFLFDKPGEYGFWMKDMNFSIDIIWINGEEIVSIKESVSPDSYPQSFYPDYPADKVLEVEAGTVSSLGVKAGDKVALGWSFFN